METFEAVRAQAGTEEGRAGFIAQYASLYRRTVDLFHQQDQDGEAFYTTERGRARAFLDSLATGQVRLRDDDAADLLAQEGERYAQRQALHFDLAEARAADPPDPALVADLEARLAEAEAAYQEVQEAIAARGAELAALVPGRGQDYILSVSQVQGLLDEGTALVSYFVLEDEALAFLITSDWFETILLEVSPEELRAQITAFRDFADVTQPHPDSAVTLYNWLVAPLTEYLPSASSGQGTTPHLAIVPHDVLHYLPFAALTDGQRYLIDDYVLTTLPSASVLPFIQENTGRALAAPLILGNPATDNPDLAPLAFAEREAQAIAALYDVQPLLGEGATESAVRERASQAGVLHLAAHGGYNRYNPLYSAIALAPDEENDGRLEVHEAYGLDLKNADRVVLSACQTQLGELSAGDELVGLTRAFFFAGTPSVVATLWSVDDQPTRMLMERFYTHLRDGMGKADALRQAQLDVRAKYPNPYFWSGFVLSGDPGEKSGYKPPARETATPPPPAEVATAPVKEEPKAEETPIPAKGGGGPCPTVVLILALGVGVALPYLLVYTRARVSR
jgi:CHAT domain-containing protein